MSLNALRSLRGLRNTSGGRARSSGTHSLSSLPELVSALSYQEVGQPSSVTPYQDYRGETLEVQPPGKPNLPIRGRIGGSVSSNSTQMTCHQKQTLIVSVFVKLNVKLRLTGPVFKIQSQVHPAICGLTSNLYFFICPQCVQWCSSYLSVTSCGGIVLCDILITLTGKYSSMKRNKEFKTF